jgi:hypothetical protein
MNVKNVQPTVKHVLVIPQTNVNPANSQNFYIRIVYSLNQKKKNFFFKKIEFWKLILI